MTTCMICHFETELDDIAAGSPAGNSVCLRCFGRETGTALKMTKSLRREIESALAALPA